MKIMGFSWNFSPTNQSIEKIMGTSQNDSGWKIQWVDLVDPEMMIKMIKSYQIMWYVFFDVLIPPGFLDFWWFLLGSSIPSQSLKPRVWPQRLRMERAPTRHKHRWGFGHRGAWSLRSPKDWMNHWMWSLNFRKMMIDWIVMCFCCHDFTYIKTMGNSETEQVKTPSTNRKMMFFTIGF